MRRKEKMNRRIVFAALLAVCSSRALAQEPEAPVPRLEDSGIAAPYLRLGWRVMGIGGHVSHGPEVAAGVLLWNHLELGFAGVARPGPINPATFQADLGGATYNGQSQLTLKSDGALVGLLLGFRFQLPGVDWLDVEVPVVLGFGAFGFYIQGEDRETPDGRRVSEWENELFDGRDSSAGFAVDIGLRFAVHTPLPWLKVSAGLHYMHVLGYDAFLATSYSGFSGSLGVEMAVFRDR